MMNWFMSKSKKEELARRAKEGEKQREMQARVNIKRTLNQMKVQSGQLDTFKKNYINRAREATLVGNKQAYQLAKSGLKLCLGKQKFLDSMIMNFELAMEMNDMNKVIAQFVNGINILSDQMKDITNSVDMEKAQSAFNHAMTNNMSQYEALDNFMSTSVQNFNAMEMIGDDVSDDEVDQLIAHQAVNKESDMDQAIESKIEQVREKMGLLSD
jgi:hypothetical protein